MIPFLPRTERRFLWNCHFTLYGQPGRVNVSVAPTLAPEILGARQGALDLANCTATVEFSGRGYLQLMGWVQLVNSTDNSFHGRQFEMDPFDPFRLYKRAPLPYCWYGITPALFDAPSPRQPPASRLAGA